MVGELDLNQVYLLCVLCSRSSLSLRLLAERVRLSLEPFRPFFLKLNRRTLMSGCRLVV